MVTYSQLSSGQKVVMLGAVLAVLCFFLPWVSVDGGNIGVFTFNGWQLMAGYTLSAGGASEQGMGTSLLLLGLLPALAVFGLVYNAMRRGHTTKADALALICLGILPLLVLYWELRGGGSKQAIQFGLLGVAIGYGSVIASGLFDLRSIKAP